MRCILDKHKKALSPMIGYVMLISIAIVVSGLVYTWVKTYVPQEIAQCPDGVSLIVASYNYTYTAGSLNQLNLSLKNRGRFNVNGYFIKASEGEEDLPTINLAPYIDSALSKGAEEQSGIITLSGLADWGPSEGEVHVFDVNPPTNIQEIKSIEILPVRQQTQDNVKRLVSCNKARILQQIHQGENVLIEESGTGSSTASCDNNWNPPEDAGVVCDGGAQCIPDGQANECTCNTGYIADGTGGCVTAPDLTISIQSTTIGTGSNGNLIEVQYTITNNGNADANNIYTKVIPDTTNVDTNPIQDGPFSLSRGGGSQPDLSLPWKYTAAGTFNPTIEIDPPASTGGNIGESDENNNIVIIGTITCTQQGSNLVCTQ